MNKKQQTITTADRETYQGFEAVPGNSAEKKNIVFKKGTSLILRSSLNQHVDDTTFDAQ